ncbi:MAG: hypothetical protein ACOY7L_17700 [Pseudomonadota bacterium]
MTAWTKLEEKLRTPGFAACFAGFQPRFCYVPRSGEMNAIMSNFNIDTGNRPASRDWEGLSELDQALRENRLMEYRIKKSWADPWGRKLTIAVFLVLAIFASFVLYWDVLKG